MIAKNDIEKLVAEVAEKSIKSIVGSNIKVQYGRAATAAASTGTEGSVVFDEPFDSDNVVIQLTPERDSTQTGWYTRLKTCSKTGFTCISWGSSATPYSVTLHWIAIGIKI